jgi:hypothetical protein
MIHLAFAEDRNMRMKLMKNFDPANLTEGDEWA